MHILRVLPVITAALLSACASSQNLTPAPLVGTHWFRVDDENASPHFPTLAFDAHTASGVLPGCGDWSADVKATGAALSFTHAAPARPQCEANSAVGAAARSFMRALAATHSAQLSGEGDRRTLTLLDANGAPLARLEPE
jgi:heat shock protein HslJ